MGSLCDIGVSEAVEHITELASVPENARCRELVLIGHCIHNTWIIHGKRLSESWKFCVGSD
jgi:hypothetical protein